MAAVPRLEVRRLECVRGDRLLFRDLDFQLDEGELLHVQGANGCGKTSLLRILAGLSQPESGEIHWQGRPLRRQRLAFLRQMIYLGHHPGVKGELTPLENLRWIARLHNIRRGFDLAGILAQAGLERHLETPARALSAGQRQRIALARLLLQEAILWILDEPFTSLDRTGIDWVHRLLDRHLERGGLVVLTSHQPVRTEAPVRHLRLAG